MEGCDADATELVPGELIFGSEGERMDGRSAFGSVIDELLAMGGWDTWVCETHFLA